MGPQSNAAYLIRDIRPWKTRVFPLRDRGEVRITQYIKGRKILWRGFLREVDMYECEDRSVAMVLEAKTPDELAKGKLVFLSCTPSHNPGLYLKSRMHRHWTRNPHYPHTRQEPITPQAGMSIYNISVASPPYFTGEGQMTKFDNDFQEHICVIIRRTDLLVESAGRSEDDHIMHFQIQALPKDANVKESHEEDTLTYEINELFNSYRFSLIAKLD